MTDLSNKPISYTGSHPLELAYRALLARAEAAEAEAARLREAGRMVQEEVAAWRDSYEALNRQRLALAARVAELAAQSAQSAQGWRDFTERPPIGEQIQIATVIDAVREEPDGLYRIGNTSEWQAWRPAPQEPTP